MAIDVAAVVARYRAIDASVNQRKGTPPNSTDPTGIFTVEEFGAVIDAAALASEMEALLRELTDCAEGLAYEVDNEMGPNAVDKERALIAKSRALLARIAETK